MSNRLVIGALAVFVSACPAWAEDGCPPGIGTGEWSAESEFTSPLIPSLPCTRVYTCGPRQTTMSSSECRRVYTYPPARRTVSGACSAGSGAADSCNACLTNPPSDPCEWRWERT
jgi:hypothetical protein